MAMGKAKMAKKKMMRGGGMTKMRGGGMKKMFSTHPPMDERIAKLRAMRMVAAH